MTDLAKYDAGYKIPIVPMGVELRMEKKRDLLAECKAATAVLHEIELARTIYRFALSGQATDLMVEQAIALLEKSKDWATEVGDVGIANLASSLVVNLKQSLVDGVKSLKVDRGPGDEYLKVEDPIAFARLAAGRKLHRQKRCAGGIVDIYDITADELIECKLRGTSAALGEAAGQLQRYSQSFPGARRIIAIMKIEPEAEWLADVLRSQGISFIEIERGKLL